MNAVLLTRKSQEFVLNSEWKYSKCGRYLKVESSKGKLVDYGSRFGRCGDGDKRGICMSLQVVLDKVVAARDRGALVVFAGSGVSRKPPSSLPLAWNLISSALESISNHCSGFPLDDILALAGYYRFSAFEEFMSVVGQGLLHRSLEIIDSLRMGEPNSVHHYLAYLLVSRQVGYIVTTNFDNLIEQAIGEEIGRVSVYYSFSDIERIPLGADAPVIFKLHGSFYDKDGNDVSSTIRATIERIGKGYSLEILHRWKKFLDGKTIVFLGYSGSDRMDVLPLLHLLDSSTIVWVDHSGDSRLELVSNGESNLGDGVRSVMRSRKDAYCVRGFTEGFLGEMGKAIGAEYSPQMRYFASNSRVRERMKIETERVQWASLFCAKPDLFEKYSPLMLGYLFLNAGFAEKASRAFREFIHGCTEEDARYFAQATVGLGEALEVLEDCKNAELCYRLALAYYYRTGDDRRIAQVCNDMAIVGRKQGDFDESFRWLTRALTVATRTEDGDVLGMTYHNMGVYHEKLGNHREALDCFSRAVEFKRKAGDVENEPLSLEGIVYNEKVLNGNKHTENSLTCLIRLNRIYWTLGKENPMAPATQMSAGTAYSELINAIKQLKREGALDFVRNNYDLSITGLADHIIDSVKNQQ